jgi:hypothetical protein
MGEVIKADGITLDVDLALSNFKEMDQEIVDLNNRLTKLVHERILLAKVIVIVAPHHANRVPAPPWYFQTLPRRARALGG